MTHTREIQWGDAIVTGIGETDTAAYRRALELCARVEAIGKEREGKVRMVKA